MISHPFPWKYVNKPISTIPDAFDWPLFEQQIAELRKGHPIEQPTYSYIICTRLPETVHVEPKEVIIVEGIMSLYDKELRDLMDLKNFRGCRTR